jgi:RNA polymerase sigma factor (sigma-70 family)
MRNLTDALILKAANGSQQACAEIYKETLPYVRGVLFNLTGRKNALWLKDMAHEVLSHVLRPEILQRYTPGTNFNSWVAVIARNKCIDFLKNKKLNNTNVDSLDENPYGYDVLCHKTSAFKSGDFADTRIMKKENAQLLWAAIENNLNEDMKLFVQLWYIEELSQEEIAKRTGWTETNIGVIHFRVKKKLREALEGKI